MKTQMATVSSKGQLVIPAEIRSSLGIQAGTRISITAEGDRIILQPITEKLIDDLRGRFAGGPSMADELQQMRRAEDKER